MLPRVLEPEVMDTPEEARDYDSMDHSAVNALFVQDFLREGPLMGKVLDLGTGTAQIPIELCRREPRANCVAVDLAAEMLALAKRNVAAAGLGERVELRLADGKRLPFTDSEFFAVMSNSIVHHIPEPATALAEFLQAIETEDAERIRATVLSDQPGAEMLESAEGIAQFKSMILGDGDAATQMAKLVKVYLYETHAVVLFKEEGGWSTMPLTPEDGRWKLGAP